jgi:hypothetical protein
MSLLNITKLILFLLFGVLGSRDRERSEFSFRGISFLKLREGSLHPVLGRGSGRVRRVCSVPHSLGTVTLPGGMTALSSKRKRELIFPEKCIHGHRSDEQTLEGGEFSGKTASIDQKWPTSRPEKPNERRLQCQEEKSNRLDR